MTLSSIALYNSKLDAYQQDGTLLYTNTFDWANYQLCCPLPEQNRIALVDINSNTAASVSPEGQWFKHEEGYEHLLGCTAVAASGEDLILGFTNGRVTLYEDSMEKELPKLSKSDYCNRCCHLVISAKYNINITMPVITACLISILFISFDSG